MLPTDDLVAVFALFDRDELERQQIVCRQFRGIPDAHFKDHPLRHVSCYVANDFVGFKRPTGSGLAMYCPPKATKVNYDETEKWVRHALVGNLEFHCTLDDRLVDVLLPFASKFRKATCQVPTRFDTLESLRRALRELLLCDTIVFQKFFVGGEVNQEVNYLGNVMFQLSGIRSCRSLQFRFLASNRFPYSIRDSADFVPDFKAALGEKFKEATSPTAFKVILSFASPRVPEDTSETLENETTREALTMAMDSCDLDGFIADVRYTFIRRAAADAEADGEEEEAMEEYWDFGEDNLVHLDAAAFQVHPWLK